MGYTVTAVGDAASTTADATGKQLVVISSTSLAGNIGAKFRTVTAPVVTWEHALWDDLGMTAAAGTQVSGQTSVAIVTPGSPLAAGLTGTVQVTSADTLPQGVPGAAAVVVARLPGTTTASDFAYDTGAAMPGLTAPARRVGLFLGDNTAATFTANGWALFDAAVTWARNQQGGGAAAIPATMLATYVGVGNGDEPQSGNGGPPIAPHVPVGVLLIAVLPERLKVRGPRPHGTARRARRDEA